MMRIAVIPARSGSKRIPEKVLQKVGNTTLLERTIEACRNSELFDEILLSTDSLKIAQIAQKMGIRVPFLREKFLDDLSPVSLATAHTLETFSKLSGDLDDGIVIQAMPTCPFLSAGTIVTLFREYLRYDSEDSVLSCTRADPLVRFSFQLDEFGLPRYLDPTIDPISRTQDHPPIFLPSGAVWISSVQKLIKRRDFYSGTIRFREINFWEGFDIDTPEQLELARHMAGIKEKTEKL